MSLVLLIPDILSLIVLGAHCMRIDATYLMVVPLAALLLLIWPRRWVARLAQMTLVLGALEWLRAMTGYVSIRMQFDRPWLRLAIILGGVALFTLFSALVFRTPRLRRRYQLD